MAFKSIIVSFFTVLQLIVVGQTRWTNLYYGEKSAAADNFIEAYDHGYMIVGRHGASYPNFGWLIKTDINGQVLWEKTYGQANSITVFSSIAQGVNGELYMTGSTTMYDEMQDAIVLMLDSCGEKLWCKIIHNPGHLNYGFHIIQTSGNGCAVLLFSGQNISEDRVCLARFSSDGELLWKTCYNSADTNIGNQFGRSLMQTDDDGFLITASCYYPDPNQPLQAWKKPYYIKVDSNGVFEWETVVHKDVGGENGGYAWSTSINPSGTYYYSSISHSYTNYRAPALLVMDLDGNVTNIYDLNSGYNNGGLGYAIFINDSLLAASASWGNNDYDHVGLAVIIDTLGNIIKSETLVQDIYTLHMQPAFDNKLAYMYNTFQNNQFDVYLTKLNYDLEDDTLYTFPFQYDSLCPYPIASDTIVQDDCDLIVGIEEEDEEMGRNGDGERMELFPNPATDKINCRLSVVDCRCSIFIYDMFGRKQEEIQIPKGQKEIQIDVSDYPHGIYIAVLRSEREMLDRKKFVVQ